MAHEEEQGAPPISRPNVTQRMTVPPMAPGQAVIGRVDRYALLARLGTGGFGAVYRARDEVADLQVALKALPAVVAHNPDELDQVRENFKLVAKLRHPSIANVLHLHEVQTADPVARELLKVNAGDWLVVIDYVPGVTLAGWRRQFANGKAPLERALPILEQLAQALDFAHSRNVVHRDIKPANVMVDPDGRVHVLDFGLAAEIHSSLSRVSHSTEDISGTPAYMAPEQWAGRPQGAAVDQYGMAVLAYELVSGAIPFAPAFETGNRLIMYNAVRTQRPERLPSLTRSQNRVLLRALAKDPRDRYPSCSHFVATLAGRRPPAPCAALGSAPTATQEDAGHWARTALLVALLVAAAVLAVVVGGRELREARQRRATQDEQWRQAEETRARVDVLLAEARAAQAGHNLDAALAAVRAALELDPANPVAKRLHEGLTATIGPDVIVPVRSEADMALKRIQAFDASQGFAEVVERARNLLGAAHMLFEAREHAQALDKYRQFLQEAERLTALNQARETAVRERLAAEACQRSAQEANATQYAADLLAGGVRLSASAAEGFERGAFEEAARQWVTAAAECAKAEALARGVAAVDAKRAIYDAAMLEVDRTLLDETGGPAWADLQDLVGSAARFAAQHRWAESAKAWEEAAVRLPEVIREAQTVRSQQPSGANGTALPRDPVAAAELAETVAGAEEAKARADWEAVLRLVTQVLATDPESARALALKREAEDALHPRLLIVARTAGQPAEGAVVVLDGVVQKQRTPVTVKLSRNQSHEVRVFLPTARGAARRSPFMVSYRALKGGEEVLTAELPEVPLPADLVEEPDTAAVPLTGLASGSREAQECQKQATLEMVLPLAVRTRKAGLRLRLVPAGVMALGATPAAGEVPAAQEEAPRRVGTAAPLYVGETEVTVGQWNAVLGSLTPGGAAAGDDLPVTRVSWDEAREFCRRLSVAEGAPEGTYRLLDEAEWEFACRAGTGTAFCAGDGAEAAARVAWHQANSGGQAHPVGQLAANAWGLRDLHGNAWEWCLPAEAAAAAAAGVPAVQEQPARGGGWDSEAAQCESTARQSLAAGSRDARLSLRVARVVEPALLGR